MTSSSNAKSDNCVEPTNSLYSQISYGGAVNDGSIRSLLSVPSISIASPEQEVYAGTQTGARNRTIHSPAYAFAHIASILQRATDLFTEDDEEVPDEETRGCSNLVRSHHSATCHPYPKRHDGPDLQ